MQILPTDVYEQQKPAKMEIWLHSLGQANCTQENFPEILKISILTFI